MNFKVEISRKILHLSSCLIAFFIFVLDRQIYLPVLSVLTVTAIIFDYSRIHSHIVSKFYYKFFGIFTRDSEKKQLTGASFVFLGSLITAFLFEKEIWRNCNSRKTIDYFSLMC